MGTGAGLPRPAGIFKRAEWDSNPRIARIKSPRLHRFSYRPAHSFRCSDGAAERPFENTVVDELEQATSGVGIIPVDTVVVAKLVSESTATPNVPGVSHSNHGIFQTSSVHGSGSCLLSRFGRLRARRRLGLSLVKAAPIPAVLRRGSSVEAAPQGVFCLLETASIARESAAKAAMTFAGVEIRPARSRLRDGFRTTRWTPVAVLIEHVPVAVFVVVDVFAVSRIFHARLPAKGGCRRREGDSNPRTRKRASH